MKLGLIVEGISDREVCEHVLSETAKRGSSSIEVETKTLGKFPTLKSECASTAAQLIHGGCDHVIILWDLYPLWGDRGRTCAKDAAAIKSNLRQAGVDLARTTLICIDKELETWLLADERALGKMLSSPEHPVRVPRIKKPFLSPDPKARMDRIFSNCKYKSRRYIPSDHAIKIARLIEDCSRVEKVPSFASFVKKVKQLLAQHD